MIQEYHELFFGTIANFALSPKKVDNLTWHGRNIRTPKPCEAVIYPCKTGHIYEQLNDYYYLMFVNWRLLRRVKMIVYPVDN